jgi:Tol biopolymer transport system component
MSFDPATERLTTQSRASVDETEVPVPSPDGRWLAITSAAEPRQIWLRSSNGKREVRLTGGDCTSFAPAWELDSKAILFASDCGRGIGLPALYRAPLDRLIDK